MYKKIKNHSPHFDFINDEFLELYQEYPEYLIIMCMLVSLDIQIEEEELNTRILKN